MDNKSSKTPESRKSSESSHFSIESYFDDVGPSSAGKSYQERKDEFYKGIQLLYGLTNDELNTLKTTG